MHGQTEGQAFIGLKSDGRREFHDGELRVFARDQRKLAKLPKVIIRRLVQRLYRGNRLPGRSLHTLPGQIARNGNLSVIGTDNPMAGMA